MPLRAKEQWPLALYSQARQKEAAFFYHDLSLPPSSVVAAHSQYDAILFPNMIIHAFPLEMAHFLVESFGIA